MRSINISDTNNKKVKKKNIPRKVIVVLFSICFLFFLSIFHKNIFKLDKVVFSQEISNYNNKSIEVKIREYSFNKNYYMIETDSLRNFIQEEYPEINVLKVIRKPLFSFFVELEDKTPYMYIKTSDGVYVMDEMARVYRKINKNDIVENVLVYNTGISIGDKLDYRIIYLKPVISLNNETFFKNDHISFILDNGYSILMPITSGFAETDEKLSLLHKIIQSYTIKGDGEKFVDLRFSKPVIK
jgi:hypothetical protein